MRRVLGLAVIALILALQVGFLPALRPFGVVPNLMLVTVVLLGLEGTASSALAVALVSGVALDITSGVNFGLWTGLLMLAALVTGFVHRAGFELSSGIMAVVLVTAGTILAALIVVIGVAPVLGGGAAGIVTGRIGWEIVLNLALTVALRPAIRWLAPGFQRNSMEAG